MALVLVDWLWTKETVRSTAAVWVISISRGSNKRFDSVVTSLGRMLGACGVGDCT